MPQSFILVQLGPSWPPPPPWPPPTTTTTKTATAKTKANNIINVHNQWSFQQGNLQEQHMFSPLLSVWIISMFLFEYPLHQQFCLFPPSYSYPLSNHKSPHRIHHVLSHHAFEHQISHVTPSPPPPTQNPAFPKMHAEKAWGKPSCAEGLRWDYFRCASAQKMYPILTRKLFGTNIFLHETLAQMPHLHQFPFTFWGLSPRFLFDT